MNVVDSSGWLELFAEGPNADFFAEPIADTDELVVPTVSIYEVFKRALVQRGEGDAIQVVAGMQQGTVVDLTMSRALAAARLSADHQLPMADAMILACAREYDAALWTQDEHFAGLPGVRYVARKQAPRRGA